MELRRARIGIIALALAMFLAACGGTASPTAAVPDAGEGETASALVGEFPTISGEGIDLNSLEGQDVVLWFWAPW